MLVLAQNNIGWELGQRLGGHVCFTVVEARITVLWDATFRSAR
jgi:hypothetical protein